MSDVIDPNIPADVPAPADKAVMVASPPLWLLPVPSEAMTETDREQITDAIAYAIEAMAKRWLASAQRRGKNREPELTDVPPAAMRTMATVLRQYGKRISKATSRVVAVPGLDPAVQITVESEHAAIVETPDTAPTGAMGETVTVGGIEFTRIGHDPFGSLPWLALPPAVDDDDDPQAGGALPWLPLPVVVEDDGAVPLQPGEPAYGGHYAPGTQPSAGEVDPKA